ncbi:uncharacterized protein [Diabrotica undecimpunctata]|uniref:uncharacterized protein n=1 Tax=Diabrotica undecimpunctata TaxID=50387 RepID=UPI003B63FFC7
MKKKHEKISLKTKNLIEERRRLKDKYNTNYAEFSQLSKTINKEIRKDIRQHYMREVTRVIEKNTSLKVLRHNMSTGKKNIHKLRNKQDDIVTDKEEIVKTVEDFYRQLYETSKSDKRRPLPKIENQGSELMPNITVDEIKNALRVMKNNKSPGEDRVMTESLKLGGNKLSLTLA